MKLLGGLRHFLEPIHQRPQIGIMLVVVALVMSGNALVAPAISLYAASFATSSTLVGMVITIFGVARLFVNYPAGALSQRIGRRPFLGMGLVVIVIGSVGAAVAPTIGWLLAWRFVQGVGSGIYMTVSYAAMADLAPATSRGRVMALQQAFTWLGVGLGPIIGGVLAERFGLGAPFWAYGAVCAAAALIVWRRLDETNAEMSAPKEAGEPSPGATASRAPVALRKIPIFVLLCSVILGLFFTRTASQWLLIPLLAHARFGMSAGLIGLALAVTAVGNFAILPLTGNLIDRYGGRPVIVYATLLSALALAVIALGHTPVLFWAGMFMLGMGLGISGPAISAYAISVVPRQAYGPAMGMLRTWGDVGFVIGPLMVGLLDDFGDIGMMGGILFNTALLSVLSLSLAVGTAARKAAPAET